MFDFNTALGELAARIPLGPWMCRDHVEEVINELVGDFMAPESRLVIDHHKGHLVTELVHWQGVTW